MPSSNDDHSPTAMPGGSTQDPESASLHPDRALEAAALDESSKAFSVDLGENVIAVFHPAVRDLLRFFRFDHLPPKLAVVSSAFASLAYLTACRASNAETTVAIRKLLEAKDAAVRAAL